MNVAWHLGDLLPAGGVALAGVVGEDGESLCKLLSGKGVGVECLDVLAGRTPRMQVRLLEDGDHEFPKFDPGVLAGYEPSPPTLAAIAAAAWVYVPVFEPTRERLKWAWDRRGTGPVACDLMDLSDVDLDFAVAALERSALVFTGLHPRNDAARIEALSAAAAKPGAGELVVTLGAAGARAWSGSQAWRVEADPVPGCGVVDTTGCGDAFAAAYLAVRTAGGAVPDALAAGSRRGAWAASYRGALPVGVLNCERG